MTKKDEDLIKKLKEILQGVDPIKLACILNEQVLPKNIMFTVEILPSPHK